MASTHVADVGAAAHAAGSGPGTKVAVGSVPTKPSANALPAGRRRSDHTSAIARMSSCRSPARCIRDVCARHFGGIPRIIAWE